MELLRPGIVAVVVTHRRVSELERLLKALEASSVSLLGCVISDHSPDGSVAELASRMTSLEVVVREDASNPGPGAGWAHAASHALAHFDHAVDALWFLDDDVVPPADSLAILWETLQNENADAVAPLLEDQAGKLWAFPEPESKEARREIREARTPADARDLLGEAPLAFCWCTGACFLVRRQIIERAGLHRTDFWMLGEDLEYSMRVASLGKAVFTCRTSVPHLPPPPLDPLAARRGDRVKFCSLLQNLCYLSFHVPYSRHMVRYLPGNFRRFFMIHGLGMGTLRDALTCLWGGAVLGQPAGEESGARLRSKLQKTP